MKNDADVVPLELNGNLIDSQNIESSLCDSLAICELV